MSPRAVGNHGENGDETIARFIVEKTLGVRVCSYDDRRGKSLPDAVIHRAGGVPLEIVSDPNKAENQLANALEKFGRRKQFVGLQYGYWVSLTSKARVNDLTWLENTLRDLEDPAKRDLVPSRTEQYEFIAPSDRFAPGEVRFTVGSGGGRPVADGRRVVAAACAVLARPGYADVSKKLKEFGGPERHAVLTVDSENDPVFEWLRNATPDGVDQLPPPQLDPEITHLWITPRWLPALTLHWDPVTGWRGAEWEWVHVSEVLNTWNDPECTEAHEPY